VTGKRAKEKLNLDPISSKGREFAFFHSIHTYPGAQRLNGIAEHF
jgi:hypothetical protein